MVRVPCIKPYIECVDLPNHRKLTPYAEIMEAIVNERAAANHAKTEAMTRAAFSATDRAPTSLPGRATLAQSHTAR